VTLPNAVYILHFCNAFKAIPPVAVGTALPATAACGRSYGLVCQLSCVCCGLLRAQVSVYTFGAPRVGNHMFARQYEAAVPDTWHVINDQVRGTSSTALRCCSSSSSLGCLCRCGIAMRCCGLTSFLFANLPLLQPATLASVCFIRLPVCLVSYHTKWAVRLAAHSTPEL
jgi:hypothetical protein